MKFADLIKGILRLARKRWAIRDPIICPIHHGQAWATGHVRDNGVECEFEHCVAGTSEHHYFWVPWGARP
jgi:hypothetical protein